MSQAAVTSDGNVTSTHAPLQNGVDKSKEPWKEQKLRMDRMIDNLKRELKEVQTMDKHLTKQFIVLGGQINRLKTTSTYYDEIDDSFAEGDENGFHEADTEERDEYDTKF